ncbi:hypothetical protein NDR77_33680 [Pseudomonas aeruginosa]|uniref:hypothetical protein n=1 Tax=Pseudomonas aeruginosa TaxID=287 RepID=UPI000AA25746|nr:hypothetical protein [Pseudomonas aeruginosa]EIU1658630.1 hypothetical protein [Pseudomonas aeruginosa]MBA4870788.1 hypothetical protein [Pseudomonas aeruginosa]MBA4988963.1 hypothetical protein [Pseudomonas aeruginosa]MBG5398106.1 hypothetical protein [Pseudomonas aeruginosa]MCM5670856.1 hypothetical protein [Pseudomonas aeruginosa]
MSEMREVFEKRMAGIFDLSSYVDAQGDIRYFDSNTQSAWDGWRWAMVVFQPIEAERYGELNERRTH